MTLIPFAKVARVTAVVSEDEALLIEAEEIKVKSSDPRARL
jgi:hypothetical protein